MNPSSPETPSEASGIGRRSFLTVALAASLPAWVPEARGAAKAPRSAIDDQGVWRWSDGREVALFGVNYCLASASTFRFVKEAGIPFAAVLDADFAAFKRLGFDALRLCFWGDWENTTADGHLVENEHLDVLDQVIARAGAAGISCLFSPIVTYDALWPDALDRPKAGFSSVFEKKDLGTDPAAIAAQVRYLGALLARTNKRTGRRYSEEPAIAAIELINEPWHHAEDQAGSVCYMNALAKAIRDTGFAEPLFYNVSQDMKIAPAIADADVNGATFGWYPTGLQAGRPILGNGLLLVDEYTQLATPALGKRAKAIYEFDASCSMASYFYPAMARAFRQGGAQFATIFTYDPFSIAASNSEMNDEFLNLADTPGKAISALIAGAAMRELPRGKDFGRYPANMRFAGFRVDDRADLSEFCDAKRFYHSNDTDSRPAAAGLEHLAGCGSSKVVRYEGTGAWFLDKLSTGVWRLEVYPDAALVANPFGFRRPSRKAVRIVARARRMTIDLPDLGSSFAVAGADGHALPEAVNGGFAIEPGVYRLSRTSWNAAVDPTFHAPGGETFAPIVQHTPPASATAGRPWPIVLSIVAPVAPDTVTVQVRTANGFTAVPLKADDGFIFRGTMPASVVRPGFLDYYVTTTSGGTGRVSPSSDGAWPGDWDFPKEGGYRVPVVSGSAPLVLLDIAKDQSNIDIAQYAGIGSGIDFVPTSSGVALRLDGRALETTLFKDMPVQLAWNGALDLQGRDIGKLNYLMIEGDAEGAKPASVTIILIERDGMAWGSPIPLERGTGTARVALAALRPVQAAMLPRDLPIGINPFWLRPPAGRGGPSDRLNVADLQAVQITLGARFAGNDGSVVQLTRVSLAS